ncbi:MAG: hypothetical protein KF764_33675 [Labilithrix sp.]|nr:hypothetical protein [Labilithrix sp.]
MRRGCVAIAVVALGLTSSCSLLLYNDDFSGAPGPVDASSPDAPLDESRAETDAGDAGEDAAPSCATATFCDDFDDGPLGAKWTTVDAVFGELTLVDGGVSPPNALRIDLYARDAGIARRAHLARDFTFPRQLHCSMHVSVPVLASDTDVELLTFTANSGSLSAYTFFLKATRAELTAHEQLKETSSSSTTRKDIPLENVPRGRWIHVGVDVDFPAGKLTLDLDGRPVSGALTPQTNAPLLEVSLGEPDDSDPSPATILYDDFWCNMSP